MFLLIPTLSNMQILLWGTWPSLAQQLPVQVPPLLRWRPNAKVHYSRHPSSQGHPSHRSILTLSNVHFPKSSFCFLDILSHARCCSSLWWNPPAEKAPSLAPTTHSLCKASPALVPLWISTHPEPVTLGSLCYSFSYVCCVLAKIVSEIHSCLLIHSFQVWRLASPRRQITFSARCAAILIIDSRWIIDVGVLEANKYLKCRAVIKDSVVRKFYQAPHIKAWKWSKYNI